MNKIFSPRGLRAVDSYTGPLEPPATLDVVELRDEAIEAKKQALWLSGADVEDAASYDDAWLSKGAATLIARARPALLKQPAHLDTPAEKALREVILCLDRQVYKAAEKWVDSLDGSDYVGDLS